eukprot:6211732-Pyramimonas_sp.AAC.2
MFLQTFHPPARNWACKTNATAIAMSAWRWLVHFCGRVSPRMPRRSGQLVWRGRRGRGGADHSAFPNGHFSASR